MDDDTDQPSPDVKEDTGQPSPNVEEDTGQPAPTTPVVRFAVPDRVADPDEPPDDDDDDEAPPEGEKSVVKEEWVLSPGASLRRTSARSFYVKADKQEERTDHLHQLMRHRRASVRYMDQVLDHQDSSMAPTSFVLGQEEKEQIKADTGFLKETEEMRKGLSRYFPDNKARMEVRLSEFTYLAKVNASDNKIKTVYNQSPVYKLHKWFLRVRKGEQKEAPSIERILDRINLVLKPGKMYLLLGPPASGKTSLLQAIAGRLSKENGEETEGSVEYNGLVSKVKSLVFPPFAFDVNYLRIFSQQLWLLLFFSLSFLLQRTTS